MLESSQFTNAYSGETTRPTFFPPLTINPPMCSVRPPPQLGGSVDLNVVNHKGISVQHLHLCVALSVLQQIQEDNSTFLWPPTLGPSRFLVFGLHGKGLGKRGRELIFVPINITS